MRKGFAAVVERDGDWHLAYAPEVPGGSQPGEDGPAAVMAPLTAQPQA